MEELFDGNIIFVFFFAMIAIYNYSDLKEFQRVAIIYITVYSLVFLDIINMYLAILLLVLSLFCFFEIFTMDETKFKILVNPIYKIIDFAYLSIFQYAFLQMIISIAVLQVELPGVLAKQNFIFKIISFLVLILAITSVLQQKFVIHSFKEMYKVFMDYPINKVKFDKDLDDAGRILTSIEDKYYFERKGYTFLSIKYGSRIIKQKTAQQRGYNKFIYIIRSGKRFLNNIFSESRGYSTIPMQLVRSLGIKRGYNYKYRRKIFELLYARMFFKGIERMFEEDKVHNRKNVKIYYLYIYFHKVNIFLGDVRFTKFVNAFDTQNKKDIYHCSNEGIFIACMGLSKRASSINKNNIDYYLNKIDGVELNKSLILEMVAKMMSKPYKGNYLE